MDFLVYVAMISVLYRIFDDLRNLLLQKVDFLNLKRGRLYNQKRKITDLTEIRRKLLVKHI